MIATGAMSAVHNCFAKAIFPTGMWKQVAASYGNACNALIIAGLTQWGLPFADMLPYSLNTEGQGGRAQEDGVGAFQLWVGYHKVPALFFAAISDNSKIQTPQPLFGGYAPCTVPGISVIGADILQKMQSGDSPTLDLHDMLQKHSVGGQWVSEFFGRVVRPVADGDVITISFATGGAGYGDPLERDPADVLGDFKTRKVSNWVVDSI